MTTPLLLTCAGAQHAAAIVRRCRTIPGASVVLANADPLCPLGIDPQGFPFHLLPLASHPDYLPRLKELCARHGVRLILPLLPHDIPLLEAHREELDRLGVHALVPGVKAGAILRSKQQTMGWLRGLGLTVPDTAFLEEPDAFDRVGVPAVVKPDADSFGSRSIFYLEERWELDYYRRRYPRFIVQPRLRGRELSADAAVDPCGRYLGCVVRERLAVLGGVALRSLTVEHESISAQVARVGAALAAMGLTGFFGLQFLEQEGGPPVCFEVNGRIMGTHPHSLAAGLDVLPHLLACVSGAEPPPAPPRYTITPGLLMARQLTELYITREELARRYA